MTAAVDTDRIAALEAKIDTLGEQIAFLTAEARTRAQQREMVSELVADLSPLTSEAMAVATRELEDLRRTADLGQLVVLLKRLVEVAPTLNKMLTMLDSVSELGGDAMPLSSDAMAVLTDRLAELERRGYFGFARAATGIVDRIVTGFSEDDVEALGDNVVTILGTVKELTQPEMLVLLQRMVEGLNRQRVAMEAEPAEPPSLWALAKKLRDPDVRRGMDRALNTLGAVSADTTVPADVGSVHIPSTNPSDTRGGA